MDKLLEKLQYIYDQEVNVGIQSVWDGGYEIWLGLPMKGNMHTVKRPNWDYADTFTEALEGLIKLYEAHYGEIKIND